MFGIGRKVEKENLKASNVYASKGNMEQLCGFLYEDGLPVNFVISGGTTARDRYAPLYGLLKNTIGHYPVVALHCGGENMENTACEAWNSRGMSQGENPLWVVNREYGKFEPFYGMTDAQVVATFIHLAKKLEYQTTPRLERVIRAHIQILKELGLPVSLTGFDYLNQYKDMGELHQNIMGLPCGQQRAYQIWADLGADSQDNSQFDLFRAVVDNFSWEVSQSGWISKDDEENYVGHQNCLQAVASNATLVLSINNMYTNLMQTYLADELRACERKFFLLLDGINVQDKNLCDYLSMACNNCILGMVSENVVEQIGSNIEQFMKLASKIQCFILYKHSTGNIGSQLADMIGKYDSLKVSNSMGTNQEYMAFLPRGHHKEVSLGMENRYRVQPEQIIGLDIGQAIIFDTIHDQIIFYN